MTLLFKFSEWSSFTKVEFIKLVSSCLFGDSILFIVNIPFLLFIYTDDVLSADYGRLLLSYLNSYYLGSSSFKGLSALLDLPGLNLCFSGTLTIWSLAGKKSGLLDSNPCLNSEYDICESPFRSNRLSMASNSAFSGWWPIFFKNIRRLLSVIWPNLNSSMALKIRLALKS